MFMQSDRRSRRHSNNSCIRYIRESQCASLAGTGGLVHRCSRRKAQPHNAFESVLPQSYRRLDMGARLSKGIGIKSFLTSLIGPRHLF